MSDMSYPRNGTGTSAAARDAVDYTDNPLPELREQIKSLEQAMHNGVYPGAVEWSLKKLRREYDGLHKLVSRFEDVNSRTSIARFPPEVLGYIFELGKHGGLASGSLPFEMIASHVCNHWRQVALRDPRLWTEISIGTTTHGACIEAYLERSRACALDVRMMFSGRPQKLAPIMDGILPHFPRIHSLSLRDPCDMTLFGSASLPVLRSLTISHDSDARFQRTGKLHRILCGGVPLLACVRLYETAAFYLPPLAGVTTLHITDEFLRQPYFEFRAMLAACTALVHLRFDARAGRTIEGVDAAWEADCPALSAPAGPPRVRLPALRSLQLSGGRDRGQFVLALIHAPTLVALRLAQFHNDELARLASLEVLHEAYPALASLEIVRSALADETWRRLFVAFPDITELKLATIGEGQGDGVLKLLAQCSTEFVPWNAMRTLWLASTATANQVNMVRDLIAARKMLLARATSPGETGSVQALSRFPTV